MVECADLLALCQMTHLSKPLSARTMSPGKSVLSITQWSVKYLSLIQPCHVSETNEMAPCVVILKRTLTVL